MRCARSIAWSRKASRPPPSRHPRTASTSGQSAIPPTSATSKSQRSTPGGSALPARSSSWTTCSTRPRARSTEDGGMIIDCHGHYTTVPQSLRDYRQQQTDALKNPALEPKGAPRITDDQIRESLEGAQLKSMRERGVDLTIFSPIAGLMGHHIGTAKTSETWSRLCNELIHRVCTLYPDKFVGVCQLPQSPGVSPA